MGNSGLDWALTETFCVSPEHGGCRREAPEKKARTSHGIVLAGLLLLLGLWCPAASAQIAPSTLSVATVEWTGGAVQAGQLPGPVTLPHAWAAMPGAAVPAGAWSAIYRLTFDDPDATLPAVYIERACSNLEVWVNGNLMGVGGGRMSEPFAQRCFYPHLFTIARALLKPGGNELVIKLVGNPLHRSAQRPHQAGLSVIQVGEEAVLREAYNGRYFANITVPKMSGAIMALLGSFILILAWIRPKERYLLFYGLTLAGWALITTRFFVSDYQLAGLVVSHFVVSIVTATLVCLVFYWGTQFFLYFVGLPLRWLGPWLASQCALAPVALWVAGPERLFSGITVIYSAFVLQFVVAIVWATVKSWARLRREFLILGPIVLISTLLILTQIAQQHGLMDVPKVHLSHFSMPLTFVAIGIRLVQQFMQALATSEQSNALLVQRVAEKTQEIEHNYAQISELRATQAAEAERQRIASDLHDDLGAKLLTIAQSSETSLSGPDDGKPGLTGARTAQLARQALDEMRLSVRGLTASPMPARDLFADWRGETLQRLELAHIRGHWQQPEPPEGLQLNARLQVQLTRVLREAISNVIRHSQATACSVQLVVDAGHLSLCIDDNGRGLPAAGSPIRQQPGLGQATRAQGAAAAPAGGTGHGLINIERRAFHLGGSHRFGTSALGGASVQIRVPLDQAA